LCSGYRRESRSTEKRRSSAKVESRPSPLNKVRTHRRDHEVDLHNTRSSATSPRSARHGLRATEIAKALEVGQASVYRALEN
jgi:hypothetical protein